MDDYLSKPLDRRLLYAAIAKWARDGRDSDASPPSDGSRAGAEPPGRA